jgi:hypothetical protein
MFVLKSDSTYQGKTLWFQQMTAIGPMTTHKAAERAVFGSRKGAASSPAMRHMLSSFEIVEIEGERR